MPVHMNAEGRRIVLAIAEWIMLFVSGVFGTFTVVQTAIVWMLLPRAPTPAVDDHNTSVLATLLDYFAWVLLGMSLLWWGLFAIAYNFKQRRDWARKTVVVVCCLASVISLVTGANLFLLQQAAPQESRTGIGSPLAGAILGIALGVVFALAGRTLTLPELRREFVR